MIKYIFVFLLFFISVSEILPQEKSADVLKLSEAVFMIRINSKTGNPTSVISTGGDGVLLIDTGFEDFGDVIKNKIKELGGEEVKYIINTHTHFDHVNGNFNFGKEPVIIGNEKLRTELMKDKEFPLQGVKNISDGLPDITINNEISLYFNGEQIRIIPLSGHTYGDAMIYFTNSKILVTGDYYFGEGFPVFYYPGGAEMESYFNNINYMLNEFPDDIKIVPGHGTFSPKEIKYYTKEEYRNWYLLMKESIEIIKSKINSGKTLEEIQKESLPEKFKHFDIKPRFVSTEKWILSIYQYYTGAYKNLE
ncbi:MAG: hypothetical protein A2068_12630 [Ignavibacteria bacterium GWB2_35_6b]|nr:MAG: hypothetical protein A2068_12630 [Ignavibacteria bacterium GWB2_35_6b]